MLWKPINFQGVVFIDRELIEQLEIYLEEKRGFLARNVVDLLQGTKSPQQTPLTFQEVIDAIKTLTEQGAEKVGSDVRRWEGVRDRLNRLCWDYVEVLESCVVEFLQQLDNVRFDHLTTEILQAIGTLKGLLSKKIDEAIDFFRQLEDELQAFQQAVHPDYRTFMSRLSSLFGWRVRFVDRMLLENLHKSNQFLDTRERELREYHQGYQGLVNKAQEIMRKFDGYAVLLSIDGKTEERYKDVYRYLKMWEANQRARVIADQELTKIIRGYAPVDQVTALFKQYHGALHSALFDMSRSLKTETDRRPSDLMVIRERIGQELQAYSQELLSMGSTIARYRDFLLRTDPNPYVRSRWGFSEWVVGPEPRDSKELVKVGYDVESLNALTTQFRDSLSKEAVEPKPLTSSPLYYDINATLHEMGQPLASRGIMRKRADTLVAYLQQLDEFGSPSIAVVSYMGEVLGKALRADWKYHVLHEISAFHHLYAQHIGLVGEGQSSEHQNWILKLKKMCQHIKEWAKASELPSHTRLIEEQITEFKAYLQQYLVSLEASPATASVLTTKRQELLEYRYLWGNFCHLYCQHQGDQVRSLYLSIDQFLEFIELKLSELEDKSK